MLDGIFSAPPPASVARTITLRSPLPESPAGHRHSVQHEGTSRLPSPCLYVLHSWFQCLQLGELGGVFLAAPFMCRAALVSKVLIYDGFRTW